MWYFTLGSDNLTTFLFLTGNVSLHFLFIMRIQNVFNIFVVLKIKLSEVRVILWFISSKRRQHQTKCRFFISLTSYYTSVLAFPPAMHHTGGHCFNKHRIRYSS
jgi:hypothetical protein